VELTPLSSRGSPFIWRAFDKSDPRIAALGEMARRPAIAPIDDRQNGFECWNYSAPVFDIEQTEWLDCRKLHPDVHGRNQHFCESIRTGHSLLLFS